MRSSSAHALTGSSARERVRYFPRQLITADDLTTEQEHFREKLRRHNRLLHGWGVVCGLEVTAAPTPDLPWRVRISEGYALGPNGDEIYVAEPVCLDLARCGPQSDPDPCDPAISRPRPRPGAQSLYVAIRYLECPARPVRVSPSGCGCDEAACEYSRMRDSFLIDCLTDAPAPDEDTSLCDQISGKQIPQCPPCPDEPWVVLAMARLPDAPRTSLGDDGIDNWSYRRTLYSTQALQQQIVTCCCKPAVAPAKVASIDPQDNKRFSAGGDPKPKKVSVTFDKALKKETVTAKAILVSLTKKVGDTPEPVRGKVSYKAATLTADFIPDNEFAASPGGADYVYKVTVKGSGTDAIRDADGQALDGDGDGMPGGDFTSKFLVTLSA